MLKVTDLLRLPSMKQSFIVAGHDGMFNVIKKLEIMEEPFPQVLEFLAPYGFMLTNFWSMKDDKEGRLELVKNMIAARCSGLGVMPGPHLSGEIDPEIIELANDNGFPILFVDEGVRWGDVISEYGMLTNAYTMSRFDVKWNDLLDAFLDFRTDKDSKIFCQRLSNLIELPIVLSTDTVVSSENSPISVALIISRIQTAIRNIRKPMNSPITVRLTNEYFAIVQQGKKAFIAVCIKNQTLNDPSLQLFSRIAPTAIRELDKLCSSTYHENGNQILARLEDIPRYFVLIKNQSIREVEKKLSFKFVVYERNTYFNYSILIITEEVSNSHETYRIYQKIQDMVELDLFVFSSKALYQKDLIKELEPLKLIIHTLSHLKGIYSADEFPLLYILAYAPYEYKSHIFPGMESSLQFKEEEKNFLDTLRLYIVIRNMSEVACILGIHTNSVKYRLTRALRILGYEEDENIAEMASVKLLVQLELIAIET